MSDPQEQYLEAFNEVIEQANHWNDLMHDASVFSNTDPPPTLDQRQALSDAITAAEAELVEAARCLVETRDAMKAAQESASDA